MVNCSWSPLTNSGQFDVIRQQPYINPIHQLEPELSALHHRLPDHQFYHLKIPTISCEGQGFQDLKKEHDQPRPKISQKEMLRLRLLQSQKVNNM